MDAKFEKLIRDYNLHCKVIEKATSIDINETPANKAKRTKKLEKNYSEWFEYYFPQYASAKCSWFHKKAANLLLKFQVIFLLLEWFRGAAKSVHTCLGYPLFLMVKGELKFMLLVGENEDKAKRLLSDIQIQLKHNQRIINDYGKQFNYGDWSDGSFTTKDGIHFHALGLGQDPRGLRQEENRPDYIVCDDLDTRERCNNDKRIREALEYITSTLWGCFDKGRQRFVMSNNRIHKNSILANLADFFTVTIKSYKEQGDTPIHYHVKVNALNSKGESSWIEKYTTKYWTDKQRSIPRRSWLREYMNRPIEDGKIFMHDWMQWKKMLRLNQYDGLVLYGDLSYKKAGDFKSQFLIGKTKRELHIIHSFCRQTTRTLCAKWLYDLYEDRKLDKQNIFYYIEGLFAMDEFVNDYDTEGDSRGYHIAVVPDKKSKADKHDRIEASSSFFERLNVFWNIDETNNMDQIVSIDQFLGFEKGASINDDAPDAVEGGFSKLNKITFVEKFEPRVTPRSQSSKHSY